MSVLFFFRNYVKNSSSPVSQKWDHVNFQEGGGVKKEKNPSEVAMPYILAKNHPPEV